MSESSSACPQLPVRVSAVYLGPEPSRKPLSSTPVRTYHKDDLELSQDSLTEQGWKGPAGTSRGTLRWAIREVRL